MDRDRQTVLFLFFAGARRFVSKYSNSRVSHGDAGRIRIDVCIAMRRLADGNVTHVYVDCASRVGNDYRSIETRRSSRRRAINARKFARGEE